MSELKKLFLINCDMAAMYNVLFCTNFGIRFKKDVATDFMKIIVEPGIVKSPQILKS